MGCTSMDGMSHALWWCGAAPYPGLPGGNHGPHLDAACVAHGMACPLLCFASPMGMAPVQLRQAPLVGY